MWWCSSVLVRRYLFELAIGFPESVTLKAVEDYALWLRIAAQTDFAYVSEPLIVYLDDPAKSVGVDSLDGWSERLAVIDNFCDWAASRKTVSTALMFSAFGDATCNIATPDFPCDSFCRRTISNTLR